MFTGSSEFYDLLYSFKDYRKEAEEITALIQSRNKDCKTVLDIACGTAEHHRFLREQFSMDGIDLNETFIETARKKNREGNYSVADMKDFTTGKKYDAVICLFSSIGYLHDAGELRAAVTWFARHLDKNGLLIIEPWFTKEHSRERRTGMLTYEADDLKICRLSHSYPEGDFSVLHFEYLVATAKDGIRHFSEKHLLRMFSVGEIMQAMTEAGFETVYDEKGLTGRGLYTGIKT
ncbi:MAG TPA: methyltransferase domain-containing protein [Bacteroidia bacterium]|nr:methyltransferase domain-containing protein [Bacteroidia bacterium]